MLYNGVDYLVLVLVAVSALPTDIFIKEQREGLQQRVQGPDGQLHLVDLRQKTTDLSDGNPYHPDVHNVYHLFTRSNPTVSQPFLLGNNDLLAMSNYDPHRRTIVLIHGWMDNAGGDLSIVLVPAFLTAEDVNVIAVDWSAGANTWDIMTTLHNTVESGQSVARFINWLNSVTGSNPAQYHITGFSMGAQQAGIVGRNVEGKIAYITALDPAGGWEDREEKFRSDDGVYTEVIHTNAGLIGYLAPLGHVDFYPNGGVNMPGCNNDIGCNHERCFYYLSESLLSGGFTATACDFYESAIAGNCSLPGSLKMGGLEPKTGSTGVFYLETNAASPFSKG